MQKNKMFEAIFPDYFIDVLREVGERYSKTQWDMGDLVLTARNELNKVKVDIIRNEYEGSRSLIPYILAFSNTDLVKSIAEIYGISFSRLQSIVYVVEFFNCYEFDIEQRYAKQLPFSHFELAKSFGPKAIEILDFDLRETDRRGGKPPSVEYLYASFKNSLSPDDTTTEEHSAINNFEDSGVAIISSTPTVQEQNEIPPSIFYFVTRAKVLIDAVEKSLSKWDIDENIKSKILSFINELQELSEFLIEQQSK